MDTIGMINIISGIGVAKNAKKKRTSHRIS